MVNKNVQLQLDVKNHELWNVTHLELYFSLIIFVLNPNSKDVRFPWKRMNLTNLILDKKLRFLRKIVEVQPIFPVNVLSYRRQNNVALHETKIRLNIQRKTETGRVGIKRKFNKQFLERTEQWSIGQFLSWLKVGQNHQRRERKVCQHI